MIIKFLISGLLLIIMGCNSKKPAVNPFAITAQDTIKRLNIQPRDFVQIDTSGVALFPLSMTETVYDKERSYKDMPNNDNWNILFYDSRSGKYHLLTESKILIQNYQLGSSSEHGEGRNENSRYIFYSARTEDYNKDKLINEKDPLYLFVSDRAGYEFRQISPSGYDLSDWKYFKSSNKVLLTTIYDKNRDSIFKWDEEHVVFEYSLNANDSLKPGKVFSNSFLDSLKLNFGRSWHRIK